MANAIVVNGQVGLLTSRQQLAAAGKYFVVTNPTPGTAIAYAQKTGFSATANGLFTISNNNASGGANVQLDYLSLIMTGTAPTGTTVQRIECYNETGIVALGTAAAARTPVNVNAAFTNSTGAIVTSFNAGAGTVPAAVGTRRLVSVMNIPTSLGVTGDTYVYQFGPEELPGGSGQLTAVRATAPARLVTHGPPITIAPQNTLIMNLWWLTAAANDPNFEFELAYIEI